MLYVIPEEVIFSPRLILFCLLIQWQQMISLQHVMQLYVKQYLVITMIFLCAGNLLSLTFGKFVSLPKTNWNGLKQLLLIKEFFAHRAFFATSLNTGNVVVNVCYCLHNLDRLV